jgi:2'-5' RNA ligase
MEPGIRAFISVGIPLAIREELSALHYGFDFSVRKVAKENLHLTLFFLGSIGQQQAERLKAFVGRFDHKNFAVSVRGIGTFDIKRPRVLFAGIEKGSAELIGIYNDLLPEISAIVPIKGEQHFRPHITIARIPDQELNHKEIKQIMGLIDECKGREFGAFDFAGIKLRRSILSQKGPEYTDL